MKIAIVGSRKYINISNILRLVSLFPKDTVIISGGAAGPDTTAKVAANTFLSAEPIIIKAEWEKFGRAAGMMRNPLIIAESDYVVAFYDGKSKGTLNSMQHAKKQGKRLKVMDDRYYSLIELEEVRKEIYD